MITINEIGKDIFDFLKEEHSEDEVVSYILSNYEVSEEKARSNLAYQYKKSHGRSATSKITLPGKIKEAVV